MTTLERYEQRFSLAPLTPEDILEHVENAAGHMARCTEQGIRTTSADDDRVEIWLSDRLQAVYDALEKPTAPVEARCTWCLRAAGSTDEAWRALPVMSMDDSAAHAQVCERNPLVQSINRLRRDRDSAESEIRGLTSELEDLRGRKIGNADAWAEAASEATKMYDYQRKLHEALKATIRSLLSTELPAGELRKAIEELVR